MNTKDEKNLNVTPTHKVGIKLLTEVQLINVFPNYKIFLNRIENHRSHIQTLKVCKSRHYQYNLMYDNVFSIFGKRGTGKTSVVFTVRQMMENNKNHPYDIVLPIIIPEVIPADCSALGWLLAIIKEQVLELEKELETFQKNSPQGSSVFWSNCKFSENSKHMLSKNIDELTAFHFSGKYNPANETSYYVAIGNSARQVENYYQFAQAIAEFWDAWIDAIRTLHMLKTGMDEDKKSTITPLIYFIFDDVDLAPEKVTELMSMIIKYLSHPNIIVIATADEEMFLEVIENNLDNNIGRLPKEWRAYLKDSPHHLAEKFQVDANRRDAVDVISEAARLYLGKVMPTSTRYYLKLFANAEEKQWFRLSDEKRLGTEMVGLVDGLLKKRKKRLNNFLFADGEVVTFYLNFLGETSRQIGNAYLGIQEFTEGILKVIERGGQKEIDEDEYLENIFDICWHFLHVAINSNHIMAERIVEIEAFIEEMFLLEHNGWKLYINYSLLQEFIYRVWKTEGRVNGIQIMLQLYSMFLFVENILLILENCTSYGITNRTRIHGISGMSQLIKEFVFDGSEKIRKDFTADQFFQHYKTMLNRLGHTVDNEKKGAKFNLDYYYDFVGCKYDKIDRNILLDMFNSSKEWLGEMAGQLSMVYGNVYLVGNEEMDACLIYKNEQVLCEHQRAVRRILLMDLRETLDVFHFLGMARAQLENVGKIQESDGAEGDQEGHFTAYVYRCLKAKIHRSLESLGGLSGMGHGGEIRLDEELGRGHREDGEQELHVSLTSVINCIDEICDEDDIQTVISRFPGILADDIRQRLVESDDFKGVFVLLKILYQFIEETNEHMQNVFLLDVEQFVDLAYELGRIDKRTGGISGLADDVVAQLMDEKGFPTGYQMVPDAGFYSRVRAILRGIHEVELDDSYEMDRKRALLEKLESLIGIAIDIENEEELSEAVLLGLAVHTAKRVQRHYLYQTVVSKYESGHPHSSKRLEQMIVHKSKGRTRGNSSKPAYYCKMFLTMNELICNEEEQLKDEEIVLTNFIQSSASKCRNGYISQLIKEVKDESFSH